MQSCWLELNHVHCSSKTLLAIPCFSKEVCTPQPCRRHGCGDRQGVTYIRRGVGTVVCRYTYDSLGQLIREDNRAHGATYTWTYDNAGNILSSKTYAYTIGTLGTVQRTVSYDYSSSSWGDLLTSYWGNSITYDGVGNPLTWGDYGELTWQGRRLMSYSDSESGDNYSYTYNADGIRTSKTVNGVKHIYHLSGTQILSEEWTEDRVQHILIFVYDASGQPIGMSHFEDGVKNGDYLFAKNVQGDITAVYDANGTCLVTYTYDAWGNTRVRYSNGGASTAARYNPLRYRGYYYDIETGFYYVSSRYYDPEIGRFINADDIAYLGMGGLTSYNLFAYCGNNPVMGYDPYGTFDWSSFGKGAGWLAIGITAICVGVSVLTCGVAAPAMMAVAAVTVTAGALTAVNGVSELGEAATGHNFVRDDVFRGNEKAYDVYSNTTAAVAEIGTAICGGWTAKNAPRIKAYNNIQNYNYTDTISDVTHMSRPYANSVLTQKQVIKYGKMTKDSFGYVFSAMGSVNGKEKLWRLGINTAKGLVWHWGTWFLK